MSIFPKKIMKSIKQLFVAMGGVFDGYRGTQMDGESQALKRLKSNTEDWKKYRQAVDNLRHRARSGDPHPTEKIELSNQEEITLSL